MKLPNAEDAIVDSDKLTDYLLSKSHLITNRRQEMIEELDLVALTRDFEEHGLKQGDIGAVVHKYGKDGFEVEFVTAEGKTLAVLTLKRSDVRLLRGREILHVREISQAVHA